MAQTKKATKKLTNAKTSRASSKPKATMVKGKKIAISAVSAIRMRRRRIARITMASAAILLISFFGLLIMAGFVPGISYLAGAERPKDLGIDYSGTDRANARMKSGLQYGSLPSSTSVEESIQRIGSIELSEYFTSEELTSLLNDRPYRYWPLEDAQLRINDDNSVEVSGKIISDNLASFAEAEQIPPDLINKLESIGPKNLVFYIKGKASISESKVSFRITRVQIGRMRIPLFVFNRMGRGLSKTEVEVSEAAENPASPIDDWLKHFDGFGAKEAEFRDGKLFFSGSISAQELTVR